MPEEVQEEQQQQTQMSPSKINMRKILSYVKTGCLVIALFLESFYLSNTILLHVRSENYFSPSVETLVTIGVMMLVIMYTYALTIGAWNKWEQYLIVPLPIALGVTYVLFFVSPLYSILSGIVTYLLITLEVMSANRLMKQLIKFNPRVILRFSSRGVLFVFSLLGGFIVLLHGTILERDINLGKIIGQIAEDQFEKFVQPKIQENLEQSTLESIFDSKVLPYDPELLSQLGGLQMENEGFIGNLGALNFKIAETVTNEVNKFVDPYRHFIAPLLAVITVALLQVLAGLARIVFLPTVGIFFALGKKIKFYHIETIDVKQEKLRF